MEGRVWERFNDLSTQERLLNNRLSSYGGTMNCGMRKGKFFCCNHQSSNSWSLFNKNP
jgi:hypothetical protein